MPAGMWEGGGISRIPIGPEGLNNPINPIGPGCIGGGCNRGGIALAKYMRTMYRAHHPPQHEITRGKCSQGKTRLIIVSRSYVLSLASNGGGGG